MPMARSHTPDLTVDALLGGRCGGAINVRGIRYQLLYSVFRAFDLYDPDAGVTAVRLEGVEDVDLLGLISGDCYIQVKTSKRGWQWSALKQPVARFLEALRADPASRFELVVGAELRPDVRKLAELASLSERDAEGMRRKFRTLCAQVDATGDEADGLLGRLKVTQLPEQHLTEALRAVITDKFELGTEAVDVYLRALVSNFLDWARDRREVHRTDMESVRMRIGEALSRETEFQAYGRGLIARVAWDADAREDDFFDGKRVRPGHISAGVDVRRDKWLSRIDAALRASRICIVRAPSGQGKSALVYRYAYECWPAPDTYVLRIAESAEHTQLIGEFLRLRSRVGLPTLVLLDDASARTQMWPFVAQECAALGVPMLVSVRVEDWHRYMRPDLLNYEIVPPELDLDEARELFAGLKRAGRVHESVDAAEWAYEKVGEPRHLLEYVYFVTHGRMLEERLRDQVRQIGSLGEDPGKVEVLRRVALADVLGAQLMTDELLEDVSLRSDPQAVLQSMEGEYIDLQPGGRVGGLHLIRSAHLAEILHEGLRDPASTALMSLRAVPESQLAPFVANSLYRADMDTEQLLTGLQTKVGRMSPPTFVATVEGVFEWGEREFFAANRSLFDKAVELIGSSGDLLFSSDFMPVVKVDVIDRMVETLGDKAGGFARLQQIARQVEERERGLDKVAQYLDRVIAELSPEAFLGEPKATGELLDWCYLSGVEFPAWNAIANSLLSGPDPLELPLEELCALTQGVFRYDREVYSEWFVAHRRDILAYLRLHLDCITLDVNGDDASISFLPQISSGQSPHDQAVWRLERLRSALPFCTAYRSAAVWGDLFGMAPSVDETVKNIPAENLPFRSDIEKNVVWRQTVEQVYRPDSYYRYHQVWSELRETALEFVEALAGVLVRIFSGRRIDAQRAMQQGELPVRLGEQLKRRPDPPAQMPEHDAGLVKGKLGSFAQSVQNFLTQFYSYMEDRENREMGRLALHNIRDAVARLDGMHGAFAKLRGYSSDYFDMATLNEREERSYEGLADLVEEWVAGPTGRPRPDIRHEIRLRHEKENKDALSRVEDAVAPLGEEGMAVLLPRGVVERHPLRYLPLAFSVLHPCFPEESLPLVAHALQPVGDVAHFFWLVPLWQGARFIDGAYRIGADDLARVAAGEPPEHWESLMPQDIPEEVLLLLPDLPIREAPQVWARGSLVGLLGPTLSGLIQERAIECLASSDQRPDRELFRKHNSRLRTLLADLGEGAAEFRDHLEAAANGSAPPGISSVLAFLRDLSEAGRQERPFSAVLRDQTHASQILAQLDGWLRSTKIL